jgi:transcriptional regulator with XRE-family HTH domain
VDSSVSQRHLSFLESGRAQPSRDLVLKLGIALDVPLRQRNAMLLAAGFAPAYQERNLSDPELSSVMQALDFMLRQQAPFPALVVDRLWNLVRFYDPAAGFMKWLLGMPADAVIPRDGSINVLRLMLDPAGLRPRLVNWQAVCADSLLWIQREAMADGPGSEATALLAELSALPGIAGGLVADHHVPNLERRALPFLPLTLAHEGVELNLFTTITTLGTPHDVTVHELRLESFFPADGATADWFRARFGAAT